MPKNPTEEVIAWHFVGATLRDGSPIPADGVPLIHRGRVIICERGLHASERLIDALKYAPGHMICRVAVGGTIKRQDDKVVGTRRTILWRIDGEMILREFARWCAMQVAHLWDMPDVVRRFLETGDEGLRAAAWDAARAASSAASSAASRDAAWAAAWDAARDAARDAAWDAAWAAAWDAARDAQNQKLQEMVENAAKKASKE